jgi:hypothetical protein
MSSTIELINRALARIGEQRLESIEDTSDRAQRVRDLLTGCRQGLLHEHFWNFAVRRARLTAELPAPEFRWSYRMPKPNSTSTGGAWLRTLGVFEDEDEYTAAVYQDEGRYLLTDHTTLYLRYIADVTNPLDQSAMFREALSYKLASELAVALASSPRMAEALAEMAVRLTRKAIAIDARDDRADQLRIDTWERSRFGGFSGLEGDLS